MRVREDGKGEGLEIVDAVVKVAIVEIVVRGRHMEALCTWSNVVAHGWRVADGGLRGLGNVDAHGRLWGCV